MEIQKIKSEERQKYKLIRAEISRIEQEKVKNNVELFVENFHKLSNKYKYIAIYWPLKNEIDIRTLKQKYLLALPRCNSSKDLKFYAWDNSHLEKDFEGIPSPSNKSKALKFDEVSLIFVPCLAIDQSLIRLGYGGGYYDKLRANKDWRSVKTIGLLTSNCISDKLLPRETFDIALDGFITEKGIYV